MQIIMYQYSPLTMGVVWLIVTVRPMYKSKGNAYYEKIHARGFPKKYWRLDKTYGPAQNGGLECVYVTINQTILEDNFQKIYHMFIQTKKYWKKLRRS